jgi:hypothetical protein
MAQQYDYFGLLPQSQRGSPGIHVSLNSYLPGSVNPLMVTPNFDESQMLPFSGQVVPRNHILIEQAYSSPFLLGVVGHSKEMVQYYQTGKPAYIDQHYECLDIPLSTSQSQYMSTGGFAYENLYNPNQPTTLPPT